MNNNMINNNMTDISMTDTSSKKRHSLPSVNIGIVTIITTFIILCMVTFATLSYVSVLNDNKLSSQLQQHNDLYYQASNNVNELIASTTSKIAAARHNNTFDELASSYEYHIVIDDMHSLDVTLIPVDTDELYYIQEYAVHTTSDWEATDSLPLLKTAE